MWELTNFTDVFEILACSWRTLSWFSSMCSLSVMHDHKGDLFSLLRFVFLFSRQYRLERELKSRLWKIDYNQLGFERRASNTSLASAMVCFFDHKKRRSCRILMHLQAFKTSEKQFLVEGQTQTDIFSFL